MGSIHAFSCYLWTEWIGEMVWNECGEVDKIRSGQIKVISVKKIKVKRTWKMPVHDNNVASGDMVITFTMYPVMGSQCGQWGHVEFFQNVSSDGITMSPVGTCWVLSQCAHQCDHNVPSSLHNGFFHNVLHNVSSMSLSHSLRVLSKIVQQCDHNVLRELLSM